MPLDVSYYYSFFALLILLLVCGDQLPYNSSCLTDNTCQSGNCQNGYCTCSDGYQCDSGWCVGLNCESGMVKRGGRNLLIIICVDTLYCLPPTECPVGSVGTYPNCDSTLIKPLVSLNCLLDNVCNAQGSLFIPSNSFGLFLEDASSFTPLEFTINIWIYPTANMSGYPIVWYSSPPPVLFQG